VEHTVNIVCVSASKYNQFVKNTRLKITY
jgi:hypothetical protein